MMKEEKINITFLVSTLPVGGAEGILLEFIKHVDMTEFSISVICLKQRGKVGQELIDRNITVLDEAMSGRRDLRVFSKLSRLFKKLNTHVLFLLNHDDAMLWGKICGRLARVPLILLWVHSSTLAGEGRLVRLINRMTINMSDKIIALSNHHREELLRLFPKLKSEKLEIIPNGIDVRRFTEKDPNPELLASLGIEGLRFRIGTVARMCREKALDVFLRAASIVVEAEPGAMFIHIGEGEERPGIERLASDLGLQGHVRFLGLRRDIPDLLNLFDIAVLSSNDEVFPLFLLEAMASELPVVSTRVGGIEDIVVPGETGYLVEPGDYEEMATCLLKLIRDQKLALKMGKAGKTRVLDLYRVEQMVTKMENLMKTLLPLH